MSPEQSAVEVSRWAREAERAVVRRLASGQRGEAFEDLPPAWGRVALDELGRLVAIALAAAILLVTAAILGVTG